MSLSCMSRCFDCFKWFPVIFIIAVIAWSYYAYVFQLCILSIESNIPKQVIYIILYHIFLFSFLISYYRTVFTKHNFVPNEFNISSDDLIKIGSSSNENETKQILYNIGKQLPIVTRSNNGAIRYCEICSIIKPDRAHHCSHCRQCILKMDHHCPWVNNCVGHANYKFFVLFLFYAFLFCIFIAFTSLEFCIKFWTTGMSNIKSSSFHLMFLFIISIAFSFSVSMLFFYHIYLTSKNRSTLESYRSNTFHGIGPDKNGFDLGWRENVKQVFGSNKFFWFLPINTSKNNGVFFETNAINGLNNELLMNSPSNNNTNNTIIQIEHDINPRRIQSDFAYTLNDNNQNQIDNIRDKSSLGHPINGNTSVLGLLD